MRSFLLLVALAHGAAAQCSMCRTASQAAQSAALNHAILILFVPAVALFCAIVILTIKHARDTPPDIEST
jgi:hypothetical protein